MSEFTWYLALLFIVLFLIIYLNYVNLDKKAPTEQKINPQSVLKSLNDALNEV